MTYEKLLIESDKSNLITKEKPLLAHNGRIMKNRIAIKKDLNQIEKACTLAEELGHHYTTNGDILDQSSISDRKQEYRARLWAYNKMIGLTGIISCHKHNCYGISEMADYLGVTEEFLIKAIDCYKSKYGLYAKLDNYMIYFEPLGVLELYK